jgi:hypothetical protein
MMRRIPALPFGETKVIVVVVRRRGATYRGVEDG